MFSRPQTCRYFALLLCVAVAGCAPLNKYSFETFSPPPGHVGEGVGRSDLLALIYSDYVARLLEGRSTGARFIREASDSSLAVGGALLAAKETLEISAETVAHMGVGIVIVQQLQKIFNAGGRSEAFADAAYLIRQAQNEYRQYNPEPSRAYMTENGAILVSRVDAAVYAAQKTLTGRLPALLDLKQATQRMTKDGATRKSSGTPKTMFNAAGDAPEESTVTPAQLEAAIDQAASKFNRRQAGVGGESKIRGLTLTAFQSDVESLMGKVNSLTEDQTVSAYNAIFKKSSDQSWEDQRKAIYDSLNILKNAKPESGDTMSAKDMNALHSFKNALP
jgi:hypothetical protein